MNCIYCGKESDARLCGEHRTLEVLGELIQLVKHYAPERCDNPSVRAYMEGFDSWKDAFAKDFTEMLELFPADEARYERCLVFAETDREALTCEATAYLEEREWDEPRSQEIMHILLQSYSRKDFSSPEPYVEFIAETEGLLHELYCDAISYLGMVGSYDEAAELIILAKEQAEAGTRSLFDRDREAQMEALDKTAEQNEKWRKKAYNPRDPKAKEQLNAIYAAKGIAACSKPWPKKTPASEFQQPALADAASCEDFCAVWMREYPGAQRGICEIRALRIEDCDQAGEFRSAVKPWKAARNTFAKAARNLGMSHQELKAAPEVFEAIPRLLDFAAGLPIALCGQGQLDALVRAARYSGLAGIVNEVVLACEPQAGEGTLAASVLHGIAGEHVDGTKLRFSGMAELVEPTFDSFVAFDVETTGLADADRITEIGAVRVENGQIVERFQMLANPGRRIPRDAQRKTGISDEMVADARPSSEVAALFSEFAGGAVLVGHNIGFDLRMLANASLPAGIEFTNSFFDTNGCAEGLKTGQGWEATRLGYLCEKLGIELVNAHRALSDAEATAKLYLKLKELSGE